MALFRRDAPSPVAVHARAHDGAHLWLAVRDATGDLALEGPGGAQTPVETEPDGELRTAIVELPDVAATPTELRLVTGRGRRAVAVRLDDARPPGPTLAAPLTPDGRGRWEVEAGEAGEVVVRRQPVAPQVHVLGFAVEDGAVLVRLAGDRTGADTVATLVLDGAELARVPLVGDTLLVPVDLDLPPGAATWQVGEVPVGRARQLLVRAHPAVVLPPLSHPDGTPAALELRWLPDGRLALQRAGG